ncbi:hypothetical protein [uncultured Christiangramia sp.]|uniref:hypothetical protein n=1 Tax=uncultured Christiangramia sp. TaxID=503836 RepID=UPI0026115851|nr:hypothetical protein [uncultured Christiangramia sp.]
MKKILYILIPVLTFSSCESYQEQKEPETQKIYSKRFEELKNEENFRIINIDSCQNFQELTSKMGEFTCNGIMAGLSFTIDDKEYFLTGSSECPTSNIVVCYFSRNIIMIKNDSIVTDLFNQEKIPIEDLKIELNNIISKPYNFKYNEQVLKPALVHLYIDKNQNINKTKKVLKEIVHNFEKIYSNQKNNFFEYNVLFEHFDITNLPPPPPPPSLPK